MKKNPMVLVVDDDRSLAQLLCLGLEWSGLRSRWASDVMEAVREVKAERPNLILMDVVMPGIDGGAGATILGGLPELAGIPIVLMSQMPESELWGIANDACAAAYVCKPMDVDSLVTKIHALIHKTRYATASG